ncbi:MAG: nucleotidyltransferase family protein [Clostridia bacterium]|nr:nucleotidyltransferase family protein [Clostridia bacterium]
MADFDNDVRRLIALVKSAITGEKLISSDDFEGRFEKIMRLASLHEVAHLAASALLNGGLIKNEEHIRFAEKQVFDESYRNTKNSYTLRISKDILNENNIPFIALKGAVIKDYYPERWMRSSCDIDILVKKADFNRALSVFRKKGFELNSDLNFHDVSLLYDDTNLELHFSICENIRNIDSVLKKVWEYVSVADGCEYQEQKDYFVFHHIAHMSYHFLAGGCGIRPFLDLWILRRAGFCDFNAVKSFCENAKIGAFFDAVMQLTSVWFDNAKESDITNRMERYIIIGGAYGYFPNNAATDTIRSGGKIQHILSFAFPPYSNMRVLYPILNRASFLLPFCYVYRLFQKTVGKGSVKAKEKYKIIKKQDSEFIKEVSTLMKMLKLDTKKGGN